MNDGILMALMMGITLFLFGLFMFMNDHKVFAIGVFAYLITFGSFIILVLYDSYWLAGILLTVWGIFTYPTNITKIEHWLNNKI